MARTSEQYRREYLARAERARARGTSYSQEREERKRNAMLRLRPDYVRPEDFPLVSDEEPHGTQGPFGPTPDPAWDYYWPTRTINPPRPRTLQARYSRRFNRLEVVFARPTRSNPGGAWHYESVPPRIWNRFKRVESPGRYINAVLNGYPMGPGGWGSIVGEGGSGVGDWEEEPS